MQYRVEELARTSGVRVDTVRFYQRRGLIPPPRREGRVAIYDDEHVAGLRWVRELSLRGFTLSQIGELIARGGGPGATPPPASSDPNRRLLEALVQQRVGERTYSRAEFAAESGVPEALLTAAQSAHLVEPVVEDGEERFTAADLEMVSAGLEILGQGFPIDELLDLAVKHARSTQSIADAGIDLFDEHIRKADRGGDDAAVTEAFRKLLPQVTRLVALHFQRILVNRALARLRDSDDSPELEKALAASESARLEVEWR